MVGTPGLKPGTYRLRGESSNQLSYIPKMAGWTGLEPATFCVTGRRSNQLSYHPIKFHAAIIVININQEDYCVC